MSEHRRRKQWVRANPTGFFACVVCGSRGNEAHVAVAGAHRRRGWVCDACLG